MHKPDHLSTRVPNGPSLKGHNPLHTLALGVHTWRAAFRHHCGPQVLVLHGAVLGAASVGSVFVKVMACWQAEALPGLARPVSAAGQCDVIQTEAWTGSFTLG